MDTFSLINAAELRLSSGSKSEPPSRPQVEWSKQKPYFGTDLQRNVSVELGKSAYLTCRVFERGDKTVSKKMFTCLSICILFPSSINQLSLFCHWFVGDLECIWTRCAFLPDTQAHFYDEWLRNNNINTKDNLNSIYKLHWRCNFKSKEEKKSCLCGSSLTCFHWY